MRYIQGSFGCVSGSVLKVYGKDFYERMMSFLEAMKFFGNRGEVRCQLLEVFFGNLMIK
ncbi:MAG: hypothetical protein ABI325_13790 [Ginsengibacter sp.]